MEAVLDPEGQFLLAPPGHSHERFSGTGKLVRQTDVFEETIRNGLLRFARLRSHERGSVEEQEEIRRIAAEVEADSRMPNHCILDLRVTTKHTMEILGKDLKTFESKLSNVLSYPDPDVLRLAAKALGDYAEESPEFRSGDVAPYVSARMVDLLDHSDTAVRRSAAVALFQLEGRPVPSSGDSELVSSARTLRGAGR